MVKLVVNLIHSSRVTVVMVLVRLNMITSTTMKDLLVLEKNGIVVQLVHHLVVLTSTVIFVLLLLLLIVGIKELL